jgi:hypothetical protein
LTKGLTRENASHSGGRHWLGRFDRLQRQHQHQEYVTNDYANDEAVVMAQGDSISASRPRPSAAGSRHFPGLFGGPAMRCWLTRAALLIGLAACIGCARAGDSEKNKDLDRPKPADAVKNQ